MTKGHIHESSIESEPPPGLRKVKKMYWDPDTEELVLIIKD